MGLRDYRARIKVRPDPRRPLLASVIEWKADFFTDEPTAMRERAIQVFKAGFAGLRTAFAEHPVSAGV